MPIRVTHLITSLDVGGAQRMLIRLLARMDRDRFIPRVISLVGAGALAPEVDALGVPVRDLGMRAGVPDPRALVRLRSELAGHPADVLLTWLYHADVLGALAKRIGGCRALVWNLRHTFRRETTRGMAARMAPHLCARLSGIPEVVVTNSLTGKRSHEAVGYHPARWVFIPNGFDPNEFAPDSGAGKRLRRALGLGPNTLLAGCVARWHPIKNIDGLLRAFGRLRTECEDLNLILVGAGLDAGNPEFVAVVDSCGLDGRVHALGPREDVPALVAGLDFLVLPSHQEGFPNVIGEALCSGVPCVVTPAGDAGDVVGPSGIVLAGAEDDVLADGMRRMSDLTRAQRLELGASGRARMIERFDIAGVAHAYERLCTELGAACAG